MGLDEDDDEYVGSGCDEKEAEEEVDDDEGKDELEEENEDDDEKDDDEEEDDGKEAEVDLGGVQSLADLSGLQPTGPRNISNNIAWTLRGNH